MLFDEADTGLVEDLEVFAVVRPLRLVQIVPAVNRRDLNAVGVMDFIAVPRLLVVQGGGKRRFDPLDTVLAELGHSGFSRDFASEGNNYSVSYLDVDVSEE
jgi:hypothetical protein